MKQRLRTQSVKLDHVVTAAAILQYSSRSVTKSPSRSIIVYM